MFDTYVHMSVCVWLRRKISPPYPEEKDSGSVTSTAGYKEKEKREGRQEVCHFYRFLISSPNDILVKLNGGNPQV